MKRILTLLAVAACLLGCERPVDTSMIIGTWNECYDDPDFVMDGIVKYTFNEDGTYQIYTYDVLSGNKVTRTHEYKINDGVITLNTAVTDGAYSPSYTITELDANEMSWQKVGTSYSPGSNSNDYKHFKRE